MKNFPVIALLAAVLLLTMTSPLRAQNKNPDLSHGMSLLDTGVAEKIIRTDIILLDSGKSYKLENIRIPPDKTAAAAEALDNLILARKIWIYSAHKPAAADRYSLPLVHIRREDGIWIQSYLVSQGLAWAFSTETSGKTVSALKQAEAQAREKHLGFWSDPAYAVKTPDNVQNFMNSFQIVQGKAVNVSVRKNYTYINFGLDWKTDFTINIRNNVWRTFGADPQTWTGKTVRVRGWVESRNGPMINLTHPEQMEILN